jgi:undecaprenyl-diphosphatase
VHALNLILFEWIAAGSQPSAGLLWVASRIAVGNPWVCVAVMGWVAWRQPQHRGFVMAALIAAGASSLVSHAIASTLNLPRPFILGLSPAHLTHGASGSLLSTHASVMFTVALLFMLRSGLVWPGIAMFALAAATGWARVYVGVHFPADIVAGLLLGVVMASLFTLTQRLLRRMNAPSPAGAPVPSEPS